MTVVLQGVSNDKSKLKNPREKSFCLHTLPPYPHRYGVQNKPSQSGNRPFPTGMEKPGTSMYYPLSFSLIGRVLLRVLLRGINNDFGNSKFFCTTLLQSNYRPLHNRQPLLWLQSQEHLVDPKGKVHPLVLKKNLKVMDYKISGITYLRKEFKHGCQSFQKFQKNRHYNLLPIDLEKMSQLVQGTID